MRILFISATYPPSVNGVAVTVENLKRLLEAKGHDVTVLAPDNSNKPVNEKGIIRYPSLDNPVVPDYPIPLFPGVKAIRKLIKSKKPDLIHVHHAWHIGYFAYLIARQYKVPLVYTAHSSYDTYAEKYLQFLPKSLKIRFVENREMEFAKKCDLVITPSLYMENKLKKVFLYLNLTTIPSSVSEMTHFTVSKENLRNELGLPNDKKILLTVSRLAPEKDVDLLIKALKRLTKDYVLVIVGTGLAEKKLKNLTKRLHLSSRVYFMGKVEHKRVSKYYQAADLFVFASQKEAQGLIFLEALTIGVPVVAVDSEAAREWVTREVGVLTPAQSGKLAKAISSLSAPSLKRMGKKAKKLAARYTDEEMIKKVTKAYEALISQKKLAEKVKKSGWQSWSIREKSFIKFPLRNFLPLKEDVSVSFLPTVKKEPVVGWCSWYAVHKGINQGNIIKQVNWFLSRKDLPVDYILIDDGWTRWGDWINYDNTKFPQGPGYISREIKKRGLKPGIWIAPYLVETNAQIVKKHPDWLVRKNGKPVDGMKYSPFSHIIIKRNILDVRKAPVRRYIIESIDCLLDDYRFDLIKLDFLYAPYFIPGITSKEANGILRELFSYIKSAYPGVYTIACGSPLVSSLGLVDSVRIGPDTISPYLDGVPFLATKFHARRISQVIGNITKRNWMKDLWNLDPDAFVCRRSLGIPEKLLLTLQKSIVDVKGNIFLGDDMTTLEEERIVKYIKPLFRKKGK